MHRAGCEPVVSNTHGYESGREAAALTATIADRNEANATELRSHEGRGIDLGAARPAADAGLALACSTRFDRLPPDMLVQAFGVDYGHVQPPEGGDMYVTRYGWPFLPQLLPSNWYSGEWFATQGNRLPGTGHVYHVSTRPVHGRSLDIVVKFSRVAREVPLEVATTFPDNVPADVIANARFNSPMEEFGLVMELRRGAYGPKDVRLLTQRPLAIYAPAAEFELWELGRCQSRFHVDWHLLAQDQSNVPKAIELDIKRIYVVLYSWIKGDDAEEALRAGAIDEQDCSRLTALAVDELHTKGFRVLDNKPRHFILRTRRRDHKIMRRRGSRIVYGLVDFELLQRTAEYQSRFKAAQRDKYWQLQSHRLESRRLENHPAESRLEAPAELPSHLKHTTILGVGYVFGTTPDGGKLWVVGADPELFDYFLPDRWRRTPRARLSLTSEVYHTRTRDGIHVAYRRSRVGVQPRVDPLISGSRRIRGHGYNSPFEETAIAEQMRASGVLTIYPRAIYRTGHQTSTTAYLRDERRFLTHAGLMTPEHVAEPVLSPSYDYYTIWGYFRGVDPQADHRYETCAVTDLEQAHNDGLLSKDEYDGMVSNVQRRLHAAGFNADGIEPYEFAVSVAADGSLQRRPDGEVDVSLCIDAQTAYERKLMTEEAYRDVVSRLNGKLRAGGWRMLNLVGHHLLLSMTPDGALTTDAHGQPSVVVCNFELISGPYQSVH